MSSTNILDDELIKMAACKLGETARRVALLAKEAETPGLRRLLTASATVLNQQAQELRVDAGKLDHEAPAPAAPSARERPLARVPGRSLTLAAARGPRPAARG